MRASYVTHLECSFTGRRYPAGEAHGLSEAGRPLLVRYDLDALAADLDRGDLAGRPDGFWRYREFLPVGKPENRVSLGEVTTPLIALSPAERGKGELLVKDEGRLPTGSFKARGLALAVSMAKELGLSRLAMPTNGNAGAALAAYASRAGIESVVYCPDDTPEVSLSEIELQGAVTWRVDGLIDDCGRIVRERADEEGWFDVSTLKEPYRIEGKKTMGIELAEQLGWSLPDVIVYPTGGGTGLIGMWKAFAELRAVGWLDGPLPRMVAVQAEGCAPDRAGVRGGRGARPPVGGGANGRGRDPGARRDRRFPHPARGAGERRLRGERERRGDPRSAFGGGAARRDAALPRGGGGLRRVARSDGGRKDLAAGTGRAVQLRDRSQVSAAPGHPAIRGARDMNPLRGRPEAREGRAIPRTPQKEEATP